MLGLSLSLTASTIVNFVSVIAGPLLSYSFQNGDAYSFQNGDAYDFN